MLKALMISASILFLTSASAWDGTFEGIDEAFVNSPLVKTICNHGIEPRSRECVQAISEYMFSSICKNKGVNPDPNSPECQQCAKANVNWLVRTSQCTSDVNCAGPAPSCR